MISIIIMIIINNKIQWLQVANSSLSHFPVGKIFLKTALALACSSAFPAFSADSTTSQAEDQITVTANTSPGADTDNSYTVPQVSTASKMPTNRLDESQSVSVVTQQQLNDYQVTSLSDAMRFVSGVAQANTLAGTEDGIMRRGFGSNSDGSIFRDGVRSSQGLNLDATTDHVEVLKGSASLLYGIQNPGGVINVVSKKPQYEWRTKVSGRTSSEGGGAGTVDVTGPLGNGFAFRLIAEKQNQDYWRNFGADKHTLIAPSLQWYGEKASVLISYEDYQYDIPYDRGTAFIDGKPINVGYKTRLDDYANHAWGRNKTFNTQYNYQFNDTWSTRVTVGLSQRRYDNNEVRVTAVNTTTGAVTRRADANRGFNHKTKYVSWDMMGTPTLFGMTHNILFGTDYEMVQTYRAHQYQGKSNTIFNYNDPEYGIAWPVTNDSTEKTSAANNLNRIHNRSVYLKDSIELTSKWTGVVGGRYQHYEQRASQGVPAVLTMSDEGNKFLPQMGLIYKVTPSVSLYSSYSKSFTPSTDADDDGRVGKPEQGTTWEVGSKWQVTPKLFATLALYRIDERDMSLSINGDTHEIDKARSSGIEMELNGEIVPGIDISANYSYDRAKIVDDGVDSDNNGNRLANAPRHSGALYLSHGGIRLPSVPGEFRIGGGARYVGTRAGDPENSFTLPDYVVADSFVAWNNALLGKETQLRLNLNNMFNKHYYASSGGNLRVREGEARNVVLEASVTF